jgi:hypothetical protein
MLILRNRTVIEMHRGIKAFLNVDAGLTSGQVPGSQPRPAAPTAADPLLRKELGSIRQQLRSKEAELARLREELEHAGGGCSADRVKPQNMIWIFGAGRTGSSWLSAMMADLEGHNRWNEPYVGNLFGASYYVNVGERMRARDDFIFGERYRDAWLNSIRNFVLEGANVRFSGMDKGGYLVIKEPNGSMGAPLVMKALPESRMVLLVRDPRDVVSSALAAQRKGSWGDQWRANRGGESLADTDPDEFVRRWSNSLMLNLGKTKEAYETHRGFKTVVRYEDLREHTLETMRRLYSHLEIPVDAGSLAYVVEKYSWENVPEVKKGPDKPHRKATPGGWREDLLSGQARVVEEITASILDDFYPGWEQSEKS